MVAVLLIGLISGSCDGPLSTSDDGPTDRSESDYDVEAYARDVSTTLQGSIDRISNLSPEQISSLRASAHELRKTLRQKDRKAIVKANEKVKNALKSTIFTDNELEKMKKYARRMYNSNQHLTQYNEQTLRSKLNESFRNVLRKEKGLKNS